MNAAPTAHPTTLQHLQRFSACGCEASFRALFENHAGLVYQAALRTGRGDRDLAEEVVQMVFTSLAQKARTFSPRIILPAWLHRHACLTARQLLRTTRRRRAREDAAALLQMEPYRSVNEIEEVIDEALNSLPDAEREALVLRFLENRDFRTVGQMLGVSDDTAQKRVSRALERLRTALARRGVPVSAAVAGKALADSVSAAVPHLGALATAALQAAGSAVLPAAGAGLATFLTMKTTLIALASAAALAGAVVIPRLLRKPALPTTPEQAKAAPGKASHSPQRTAPSEKSGKVRAALAVAKGPHFPTASRSGPASPKDFSPDLKEVFMNHPKTKLAEKRVNEIKNVAKVFLDRINQPYRECIARAGAFQDRSTDASLTENEREAAKQSAAEESAKAKEMEVEMDVFRKEMEAFLQRNVLDSRELILKEIQDPTPPRGKPTAGEIAAFNAAESQFLQGNYAAAEKAFASVAASASPEVTANAQWKVMLSRMIQGQETAEQIQPLLLGDTTSACYALAAHYAQQGHWEDANVWIVKAREAGDPAANVLFDDPLRELGWMDPQSGLLVPPDSPEPQAQ